MAVDRTHALVDLARPPVPFAEVRREIGGRLGRRVLLKRRRRVDDRDLLGPRDRQKPPDGVNGRVEPRRTARISGVGPTVRHVDDDQCRASAKAELALKDAALFVKSIYRLDRRPQTIKQAQDPQASVSWFFVPMPPSSTAVSSRRDAPQASANHRRAALAQAHCRVRLAPQAANKPPASRRCPRAAACFPDPGTISTSVACFQASQFYSSFHPTRPMRE